MSSDFVNLFWMGRAGVMTMMSVSVFLIFTIISGEVKSERVGQETEKYTGAEDPSNQVSIRRTKFGVPHIDAENIKAAGFALGYVQIEDYGDKITDGLIKARGEWARFHELNGESLRDAVDRDAEAQRNHLRAVQNWHLLEKDTRDIMEGFAMGVNRYVEKYPGRFEPWVKPDFTGYDVLALEIKGPDLSTIHKFLRARQKAIKNSDTFTFKNSRSALSTTAFAEQNQTLWTRMAEKFQEPNRDVGSNAWALAPGRTKSGKAVLLRNPHLNWDAGYYEAQLKVAGYFNYYGDFRIGAPLDVVGGFNGYLGWATTNNNPVLAEIYALEADSVKSDHYLLDGTSLPLQRQSIKVAFKNGRGTGIETREFLGTPYGPVIFRGDGKIYIIHSAEDGGFRSSEQYLKMMKTKSLEEWKQVMRMQAIPSSNYTYADGQGNIFYVWNAAIPALPLPWGGDTTAVSVTKSDKIWKNLVPWDSLPQLKNPKGGYLHNENSSFHFTNLNAIFNKNDFPPYFQPPDFSLRSQKSYEMIGSNQKKFSLEDVVRMKYNEGMLLADRVKDDLISAVRRSKPEGEIARALELIEKWNNTVEKDSRGSMLFKTWWDRYVYTAEGLQVEPTPESVGFAATASKLFKEVWSPQHPATTPSGLADWDRAAKAFEWAVGETKKKYGSWDVSWGKIHRAIAENNINVAIGGCSGVYGCFRVFWYKERELDGNIINEVTGGDGWVIAVEFDKVPRAYSVLAYGESNNPKSPYYYDQLEMFSNKEMKVVYYIEPDISKNLIREYRPGQE